MLGRGLKLVPKKAFDVQEAMNNDGRASSGSIAWPLTVSFIGAPVAVAGNVTAAGIAAIGGSSRPWDVAAVWAPFWGSLSVYAVLALLIIWRCRRERRPLPELVGFRRDKLGVDLLLGVGVGLAIAVFAALAATLVASLYPQIGESLLRHANGSASIPVPAWFWGWTLLVTPLAAAVVEEVTYRGYALPNLAPRRGNPAVAIALTSLGFGLQHAAFPFIDLQVSIYRIVAVGIVGYGLGWMYLKLGRLLPLMIGHYLWDGVPAALAVGIVISRSVSPG